MQKIEDLGYDDFFENHRVRLGLDISQIARVIAEHRGVYKVKNGESEYFAKITGKQVFEASSREDYPAVGDWVAMTRVDKEHAIIHTILPRKTIMQRKYGDKNKAGEKKEAQIIASNIDVAFVIESVDRDYNLNRIERYFAIAHEGGVYPAIILNKIDLISKEELDVKITEIKKRFAQTDVILTSTLTHEGVEELREYIIKGKTYCFLGSSGVGKSSLINNLLGSNTIRTGDVGMQSGRGKHTTTAREMYFLAEGGIVIDNPGVREVGMIDVRAGIEDSFTEITALAKQCKYSDCMHSHEPDCAVLEAVKEGKMDKDTYANYRSLKKETDHYEMTKSEKKEKNRQFGKFIKKAKKELKSFGHKDY